MKKLYSGMVLVVTPVVVAIICALLSTMSFSQQADAFSPVMPMSRVHTAQGIHAPVWHGVQAPAWNGGQVVAQNRDGIITAPSNTPRRHAHNLVHLEQGIVDREAEIARLQEEIRVLEEKMKVILKKKIARLQKKIAFLQRHQEKKAVQPNDLSFGDTDSRVRSLQVFLNGNGFALAKSGPGSTGEETTYFGPLTERSLRQFQAVQHIPVTGVFDAATRAAIVDVVIDENGEEQHTKVAVDTTDTEPDEEEEVTEEPTEEKEERTTLLSLLKRLFHKIFGGGE